MVKIIFRVAPTMEERVIDASVGHSLMEEALRGGIDGIAAECGGACSCATCHVVIDGDWFDRLPPIGDQEEGMLDFAEHRQAHSRLSCQVVISAALDGMSVTVPEPE